LSSAARTAAHAIRTTVGDAVADIPYPEQRRLNGGARDSKTRVVSIKKMKKTNQQHVF